MVCKNVFPTRPVSNLNCLWGRGHRNTVKELLTNTLNGRTTIILGPRRVGKTSIVMTMMEEFKKKHGHYIYFNFSRFLGAKAIGIADLEPQKTSLKLITTSKSYKISFKGVDIEIRKTSIEEFTNDFSRLMRVFSQHIKKGVVVFDEAQVLARLKNIDFRGLLQEISDSYTNIALVFTGSMPGILLSYLNPKDARKPNFMRGAEILTVPRWTSNESVEFLRRGFKEYGIRIPEEHELIRAAETLGGIPGFISYYGITVVNLIKKGFSPKDALPKALDETLNYAKAEWRRDITDFLNVYDSPIYVSTLKVLATAHPIPLRGAEVFKKLKELGKSPMRIQHIYKYLENLEKAGFIRSSGGRYWIEDPVLRVVAKELNS